MTFTTWVRSLRSARKATQARRRLPRPSGGATARFRPRLEAMEDRSLPSGGVLDPTFGTGGLVTTAVGSYSRAYAVATYPSAGTANDGKVVAAGDAYPSNNTNTDYMEVVRYNPDGTLDRTFGSTGEVMVMPGGALAVQVQPDGKVVAAGFSGSQFAVVRYNADGTPDASFGSRGKVLANVSKGSTDFATAVVLQADGKIVVAGFTNPARTTYDDLFLARFNADGTPDASFGTGGKLTTRFPVPVEGSISNSPVTLAIDLGTGPQDPNRGKLVVGCALSGPGTAGSVVARYTANGAPDQGFGAVSGHPGYVMLPGYGYSTSAVRVAVQADDRIVAAGPVGASIGVDRLNPDGSLDMTFGSGGVVVTPPPPAGQGYLNPVVTVRGVAALADGTILVAGQLRKSVVGGSQATSFLVARYNAGGGLDTTFGVDGIAAGGALGNNGFVGGVALEPDGRIVEGGASYDRGTGLFSFALARFLAAGPQIASFAASPNPVTAGDPLTLTAWNIMDANPGSTVIQVAFYVDSNGDGRLDPVTDTLLGYGATDGAGHWTFTVSTAGWAAGTYTLFAQATDSYGVLGDPLAVGVSVV